MRRGLDHLTRGHGEGQARRPARGLGGQLLALGCEGRKEHGLLCGGDEAGPSAVLGQPPGTPRPRPPTAQHGPLHARSAGPGQGRGLAGGNRGVCDGGPRGCRLGVRSGVSGASAPGLRPRRPRPAPGSRGPGTPPGWGTTIAAGARVHTHVSWSLVTSTHVHGRAEQLQQGPSGLQSLHYLLSGPFPKKPADLSQ